MTATTVPLPIPELLDDWKRHLRARGKAPSTIVSYLQVAGAFAGWLQAQGYSADARDVALAECEHYLIHVRETTSPANEAKHYRSLKQLWRWLVDIEEELALSPMRKLRPPAVPVKPVPVLPDEVVIALLKACAGRTFNERRDTAIIRLLLDTGMRLGELVGLTVDGVDELGRPTGLDWRYDVAHVVGKGDRSRACPFGARTGDALRRYLRARAQHKYAATAGLWLGQRGTLTHYGVSQMLLHRCEQAAADPVNPHRFRHTAAHTWLVNGGQEVDLMRLMGWRTREMVARYAESAADQRAQQAYRRLSLGERI